MDNDIVDYYDGIASGYDKLYGKEQIDKLNLISGRLNPKKDESLLDIGCGTGISAEFFDCKFFGIEPSEKMLNIAKEKYSEDMFDWRLGGGEDIIENYNGMHFDYIICVTSAHHIVNISKLFEDIKQISKEDTKFCFSLLKNSTKNKEILSEIKRNFEIVEEIVSDKDLVIFFEN